MDAIRELLQGRDFNKILQDYNLYQYELLFLIAEEIFGFFSEYSDTEKEMLKNIYIEHACMFHLNEEKVMLVSDTHISRINDNIAYLYRVLEYCKKNSIHHLIHAGDIGNGKITVNDRRMPVCFSDVSKEEVEKERDYLLCNYPTSPDIHQYILAGNHDSWYEDSPLQVDILKILAREKKINPLGFYQAFFTFYGYYISLEHENRNIYQITNQPNLISHLIKIKGHYHKAMVKGKSLYVPPLYKYTNYENQSRIPGFIVMNKPIMQEENVTFQFDRFYCTDNDITLGDTYTLTRKLK